MPLSQKELDLIAAADTTVRAAAQALDKTNAALQEFDRAVAGGNKEEIEAARQAAKDQGNAMSAAVRAAYEASFDAFNTLDANPASKSSDPKNNDISSAWDKVRVQTLFVQNRMVPTQKSQIETFKAIKAKAENPQPPVTDGNTAPTGSTEGNTDKTNEDVKQEQREQRPGGAAFNQDGGALVSPGATDDRYTDVGKTNDEDKSGNGDPSQTRLSTVGLAAGGVPKNMADVERSTGISVRTGYGEGPTTPVDEDWRVRISLATNATIFYKSANPGIQSPLLNTSGVVFPYTPSISVQHNARYGETKLTHSNYASYFYEGSDVSAISISGDFTVQSQEEGKYVLAAMTFFRSCTKMWFGTQTQPLAGNPPPMVFLNGFGKLYFPNVPCVITGFNHTMPAEVDYIEVKHSADELNPFGSMKMGGIAKSQSEMLTNAATRVPTSCTMSVTVQPVYSRRFIHENFNLDSFADGSLLLNRGGFL